MSSTKTVSKGIRLRNEVAEYFNGKPLNRYIESMYEKICSGEIEECEDGIEVHTKNREGKEVCAHRNNDEEIPKYVSEMDSIGKAYGLSGEEMVEKVIEAMEEGAITYEGGQFRAYSEEEYDLSRFKEACMDKGVPIQKMLDKAAQMVWSS